MKEISRKNFLRVCGTIVAGGAVAGMSGVLIDRRMKNSGFHLSDNMQIQAGEEFISPYRPDSSFESPDSIQALACDGDGVYVATTNTVSVFDIRGKLRRQFVTGEETVRDMAIEGNEIYLLHRAKISVYSLGGERLREWEACSELSNYCSLVPASGFVFVTDVNGKNICKYTRDGNFVTFIDSPNRFVIPSLTFGIECIDNVLYCSNSGRHQVESYTLDGKYLGVFGKYGPEPGLFTGCCNPVYLSHTAGGDIITSEKGAPRICCYGRDGSFRSMLLDTRSLGGGNTAYGIDVCNDRLFVAGKNRVSVFRYDATLASAGACASCGIDCPLRSGSQRMQI
jgi:hypothetical protein